MIKEGSEVKIEYTLKLEDGTVADTNVDGEPLEYTQGEGQVLPALEKELEGLKPEESKTIMLEAKDAYGERDPEALREVSAKQIPESARTVGTLLVARDSEGGEQPVRVHEVNEENVVLDLNHPLAGHKLCFEVRVLSVA